MKKIFIILFTLITCVSFAQNLLTVNGTISNTQNQAIEFANVLLLSAIDSSLVKGAATDFLGNYKIETNKTGTYFISAQYIGFEDVNSNIFTLDNKNITITKSLKFTNALVDLETVEVKSKRQLIEVQPDKMVFNVEGSINATGNTALELLRKSPGVIVDNNDNILLSGKQGVQVYIDGKPTYMSAEDLAVRLNTMQSSEIDAIEIITEPSAKYDAEGNAGIINIKMKKDKSLGANASINLGYAYGVNHKGDAGVSLNFRNKKVNVFGGYNFKGGNNSNWFDFYRLQNGQVFELYTDMKNGGPNHSARIGTDFFINQKHTIGFLINGYNNDKSKESDSKTLISNYESGNADSVLVSGSYDDNLRSNLNTNINYQFEGDNKSTVNVDLDYGTFKNNGTTDQPNTYKSPDETQNISEANFESEQETTIDIYAAKIDYEKPLTKGKIGFGAKHATVKTNNDYNFFQVTNDVATVDEDLTNEFSYKEVVNAAYVNYNYPINKKVKFNGGVRYEHTNSIGELIATDTSNNVVNDTSYNSIFPSVGLTYQFKPMHQFKLGYNKRIGRPNYQDLNPFVYRLSELSYRKGNAFLRPKISHNVSISHTYKYTLNTTLSYTYTKDFSTYVTDTLGIETFLTPYNLDNQQVLNLGVSYPVSPKNWWNTFTSVNNFYMRNYAELATGRIIEVDAWVASLYHQSTFLLPKDFSVEVSGWASSPSIWGADYQTEGNWSVDLGVKKKVFDGKGNLKIAFTDVFHSAPWYGEQSFGEGYFTSGRGGWESQQIRLNFNYLFGNNKVKAERKRKTGLDAEKQRLKSQQ